MAQQKKRKYYDRIVQILLAHRNSKKRATTLSLLNYNKEVTLHVNLKVHFLNNIEI